MTELLRITDDDAWLDLAEGEHGIVVGMLDSMDMNAAIISFPDWSRLLVEIDGRTTASARPRIGSRIELEVIRTEDGLVTNHELILKARDHAKTLCS